MSTCTAPLNTLLTNGADGPPLVKLVQLRQEGSTSLPHIHAGAGLVRFVNSACKLAHMQWLPRESIGGRLPWFDGRAAVPLGSMSRRVPRLYKDC